MMTDNEIVQFDTIPIGAEDVLQLPPHLKDFLDWFNAQVITYHYPSLPVEFVGGFGIASGAAAAATALPLGGKFGLLLAQWFNVTDTATQNFLAGYFAFTAYIPISFLVARITRIIFMNMVTCTPAEAAKMRAGHPNLRDLRYGYIFLNLVFGAIANMPDIYITYDSYSTFMGLYSLFLVIPDAYAGTLVSYWSLDNLFRKIYGVLETSIFDKISYGERNQFKIMRTQLRTLIHNASSTISALTEDEIITLWNFVIDKDDRNDLNSILQRAKYLLSPNSLLQKSTEEQTQNTSSRSWPMTLFGGVGSIIGGISTYPFFKVGVKGSNQMLDRFSVNNETARKAVGYFIGTGALIFRGSLAVFACYDSFTKFFAWFCSLPSSIKNIVHHFWEHHAFADFIPELNKRNVQQALTVLAIVIAISAATPREELMDETTQDDTWYKPLLMICGLLGPFATFFWSVNSVKNDFFVEETKKDILQRFLHQIEELLPTLSDQHILALYSSLAQNNINNAVGESTSLLPTPQQ